MQEPFWLVQNCPQHHGRETAPVLSLFPTLCLCEMPHLGAEGHFKGLKGGVWSLHTAHRWSQAILTLCRVRGWLDVHYFAEFLPHMALGERE